MKPDYFVLVTDYSARIDLKMKRQLYYRINIKQITLNFVGVFYFKISFSLRVEVRGEFIHITTFSE